MMNLKHGYCIVLLIGSFFVQYQTLVITPYDIVAIKENHSLNDARSVGFNQDGFQATNVSLRTLIASAYAVPEARIDGLNAWAARNRYDVSAKWSDPSFSSNQSAQYHRELLKHVLGEFSLAVHLDEKRLSGYRLEVAKKKQPQSLNAVQMPVDASEGSVIVSENRITMEGASIESLAKSLASELGKPVVDATGLTGRFNLNVEFNQESCSNVTECQAELFTALRTQLGLRLVPAKVSATIVVVDHVRPPRTL